MSNAQRTFEFAVFSGIIDKWNMKDDPNFAEIVRDSVIKNILSPHLVWAIKEVVNSKEETKDCFLKHSQYIGKKPELK